VRVFSRFCAEQVTAHYPVRPHIVAPAVDLDAFHPQGCRDLARPKLLFTADLWQRAKGPQVMALAFNHIHRARPGAVLQFAGPVGPFSSEVADLLGLIDPAARSSVELLGAGSLARLPRLYAEAAVTVLPSLGEPFGMVLTESLASGTPVVGTRSGAIPEIVSDPAIGSLFERTDDDHISAGNLAQAVLRTLDLLEDPATSARCRAHAGRFGWDALGPRLDTLQEAALRGPVEGLQPARESCADPIEESVSW
jgi:glycosyltransferase involved in cell wall biosynthesis